MKLKNKRGNILTENVIFIILNLVFLIILVMFLFLKMNDASELEEKYAKQIALMIDAARPGMDIALNMEDALDKVDEDWLLGDYSKVISIQENVVTVKLREDGWYSYSFFNNVGIRDYQLYPNGMFDLKIEG